MYKFKNSAIAIFGLLVLIVAITILLPHLGYGSNAAALNPPTSQAQNVNVVNTPTVNAQQTGIWNVGIDGTPTVGLANGSSVSLSAPVSIDPQNNTVKIDAATPVSVRDSDNPARNPFAFNESRSFNPGSPFLLINFLVPPNKRLVIEQVSVVAELAPAVDQILRVSISSHSDGIDTRYDFVGQDAGTLDGTFETYVASSQMRTYANAVQIQVVRTNTGLSAIAEVSLSGYLIDIP